MLDVGCGIGGTSRHLAREQGCSVLGITISGNQVHMAQRLSAVERSGEKKSDDQGPVQIGEGNVRFIELDAEKMGEFFRNSPNSAGFDAVWISEAMSHLPDKKLFFRNAFSLLKEGGKLVVADWFKAEQLTPAQLEADIKPIEGQWHFPYRARAKALTVGRWDAPPTAVHSGRVC